MKEANKKFKLIYDKKPNDNKLNGSVSGIPAENDAEIEIKNVTENTKLIYEDTKLVGGESVKKAVPTSGHVDRIYFNTSLDKSKVSSLLKLFYSQDSSRMPQVISKLYSEAELLKLQEFSEDAAEFIIMSAINPFINSTTDMIAVYAEGIKLGILYLKNQAEIKLWDLVNGWNKEIFGDDLGRNYIEVNSDWITSTEVKDMFNIINFDNSLWKPGTLNSQIKDLFYIQEGESGPKKEVKILKASEKNIPTSADKEVCELNKLIGE